MAIICQCAVVCWATQPAADVRLDRATAAMPRRLSINASSMRRPRMAVLMRPSAPAVRIVIALLPLPVGQLVAATAIPVRRHIPATVAPTPFATLLRVVSLGTNAVRQIICFPFGIARGFAIARGIWIQAPPLGR